MLAELTALSSHAVVRTYAWGLDLSGSFQGAGGVGGLLFANFHVASSSSHAVAYDGNGNVVGLTSAADGSLSARYDYNAFGEITLMEGLAAAFNPFRFSTKFSDEESGLLYYGLRYYSPVLGRWTNRDPQEEEGGINVYGFVANAAIDYIDILGEQAIAPSPPPSTAPKVKPRPPRPRPKPVRPVPIPGLGGALSGAGLGVALAELVNQIQDTSMREMIDPTTPEKRRIELCKTMARLSFFGNSFFYGNVDPYNRSVMAAAVIKRLESGETASLNPPGTRAANALSPLAANAGHLVARVFGGHNRYENLATQEARFNQVFVVQAVERPIREHIQSGGCAVCFVAIPRYKNDRPAPSAFTYITIFSGAPPTKRNLVEVLDVSAPTIEGDYNAEAEPWRTLGRSFFDNGIGPIN